VAQVGECYWCECARSGMYKWVQLDCPPQYLIDEFGNLGTLRMLLQVDLVRPRDEAGLYWEKILSEFY